MGVAAMVALFLLLPAEALAGTFERGVRWLAGLLGGEPRRVAAELPWDWIAHGVLFALLAWAWCAPAARAGQVRGVLLAAAGAVAYGGPSRWCRGWSATGPESGWIWSPMPSASVSAPCSPRESGRGCRGSVVK